VDDTRLQEAVAELREAGMDEVGIQRCLMPRWDGKAPLEVLERQLRYLPYREPRPGGRLSGLLLASVLADWAPPGRWVALQGDGRRQKAEGRRPAERGPEENQAAYAPVAPPIGRDERPAPRSEEERSDWELIRAYHALPSRWVRVAGGGRVRECRCPSPAWAAQTERLRALLGVEPWREFEVVEGRREEVGAAVEA
jgi:hypothetical protein